MKTKDEMIARYKELYKIMAESKDVYKMKNFGQATSWLFCEVANKNPDLADVFLSQMEASEWNNYLSEREMMNISKRIVNEDESKGFHWNYDTVVKALKELGGSISESPYYNCYAMVTVMNMIYSDYANSIAIDLGFKTPKDTPNGNMAMSCYRKALEKLKDPDREHFVREYFSDMMYDGSPMKY